MKFTEGYWLRSQQADAVYATQAYYVDPIPGGMRIVASTIPIQQRGNTLNIGTITIEFRAVSESTISVRAWHYEGFDDRLPHFEKSETILEQIRPVITEDEAVLDAGRVLVRVSRKNFGYTFEADGKILTTCGFRNLGYIRWDKKPSTMFPEENYLTESCTPYMVNELSLGVGENVYGFGERFTAFVKNGQVVETWNEDGGTASQVGYKCVPFYLTNRGYGVLVDSTDHVSFEVASEKVEYVGFSVPGEEIGYYLFYGPTPKDIIREYTSLTGRPALPPAWSFGLWLSTSFTTDYREETTSAFIDGMFERDIPMSVFHFDCFWMPAFHWCDMEWDKEAFPDIRGTIRRYHEKGLKICCWINPYVAQGTEMFREGKEKGYFLMRSDGKGVWQTDNWQPGMAVVDFTNPDACKWYQDRLRTLLDVGVDCFKTDFGERIPVNVIYHDGSNPRAMHNYYTFLYNRTVFSLLEQEKGEHEAVLFARSATAGGQQFPVHWGGDCYANYPSMAETLRGGLSFAMSGFAFWSHDISGFESTATPDLYKRWAAFGLLSSHSRLHGSGSYRVPWLFDEEASRVVAHFSKLKCRLMPALYASAVEAHEEGTPLMRPMVFEFPDDPAVLSLDAQYMLGDALLVAPVMREDGVCEYYLPEGCWTHLLTGEVREGGRWQKDTYDYFSLPLYVRQNTLLPVGAEDHRPDYDYMKDLTLHYYQPVEGKEAFCRLVNTDGSVTDQITACLHGTEITVTRAAADSEIRLLIHTGPRTEAHILPAGAKTGSIHFLPEE